jgi:hypothetical protein
MAAIPTREASSPIDIKEDYFIHGSSQVLKSGEASTQEGAMTQYIKQLIMYFILC